MMRENTEQILEVVICDAGKIDEMMSKWKIS